MIFLGFSVSWFVLLCSMHFVGSFQSCSYLDCYLGQLPIKYSLNCLVDGPIEAAHCLPMSVKYEQNALLILSLSSVWILVILKM